MGKLAEDPGIAAVVVDISISVTNETYPPCLRPDKNCPLPLTSYDQMVQFLTNASKALARNGSQGCRLVLPQHLKREANGALTPVTSVEQEIVRTRNLANVCFGYTALNRDLRTIPWHSESAAGVEVDSLARVAVRLKNPNAPALNRSRDTSPISSFWRPENFQTIRASEILAQGTRVKGSGLVAIIGGDWHTTAKGLGLAADPTHDSPVGPLPGYLLHANYIESLLSEVFVGRVLSSHWGILIEIGFIGLFLYLIEVLRRASIFEGRNPLWHILASAAFLAAVVLMTSLVLQVLANIYFDVAIPALMAFGHAGAHDYYEAKRDQMKYHEQERKK